MFKAKNHDKIFKQLSDNPRVFPQARLDLLNRQGLLKAVIHESFNDLSRRDQSLLKLLFEVGRGRSFSGENLRRSCECTFAN